MNKCKITILEENGLYEGQYEIDDGVLIIEIFDFFLDVDINKYISIIIDDSKNQVFYFSSYFRYSGSLYGVSTYVKYKAHIYLETKDKRSSKESLGNLFFNSIVLYNPILNSLMVNTILNICDTDEKLTYSIEKKKKNIIIQININNIAYIEIGTSYNTIDEYFHHQIDINFVHYCKLIFEKPILFKDAFSYINEFDIIAGSFNLIPKHSYETYIIGNSNIKYKYVHNKLSHEKYCEDSLYFPIKNDLCKYFEIMYKKIDFRNNKNNKFVLLDFNRPTMLEDKFTYYYRFVDLYMGHLIKCETGKEAGNYARLSKFIDDYKCHFYNCKYKDVEKFKNEINSLRNHFVHEGYYFPNNKFDVKSKREIIYQKDMDYQWLFEIVKSFRFCSYLILYKDLLGLDIDEKELEYSLIRFDLD